MRLQFKTRTYLAFCTLLGLTLASFARYEIQKRKTKRFHARIVAVEESAMRAIAPVVGDDAWSKYTESRLGWAVDAITMTDEGKFLPFGFIHDTKPEVIDALFALTIHRDIVKLTYSDHPLTREILPQLNDALVATGYPYEKSERNESINFGLVAKINFGVDRFQGNDYGK